MVNQPLWSIISLKGWKKTMTISLNGIFKDLLYTYEGELISQRDWRSNTIVYSSLDLIANLLKNNPRMCGILYWAVGEGSEDWDENPRESDPNTKKLVKEIYRKPIHPEKDILYHEDRKILEINAEFRLDEAVGTLREFGLFGGDATSESNTGLMINYKIHPKIVKTNVDILKRKLLISLALTPFFRSDIEAVEGIGESFGAKLRSIEPPIMTLQDLSQIDETKVEIDGVSRERLKLWKDMATLMTSIEGLDGNGAEILVKGGGISTPHALAAIDTPEKVDKFYSNCIKAAESMKLPADYVNKYFVKEKVMEWIKIVRRS